MTEVTQAWVRALGAMADLAGDQRPLPCRLADLDQRFGPRPALLDDAGCYTYHGLSDRVGQYARWAQQAGVRPGEVVCLSMANCAEYVAIWLGVTRVGGVVALLNTGLRQQALAHAITIVSPHHLVADAAAVDALEPLRDRFPQVQFWRHGGDTPGWSQLDVAAQPAGPLDAPGPAAADPALLIYTSGTTGLPKAVTISHGRVLEWSYWFAAMMDITPEDRMYDCLPMYHSVGGVVAVGALLVHGGSVLIRPGFSASRFWHEVAEGGCTLFQYIGELCRYLVNSPPHPRARAHRLRLACGNGLQAEVWTRFVERFAIPRVLEYYAATEGSVSLYNVEGRPGAIGRVPPFLAHRFPVALIRIDRDTGVPERGADGHCVRCAVDEAGEALGPVPAQGLYTDPAASAAKILRDVFAPGDAWFRTGDLMRRDRAGFFSFVDRAGDTFRWKGENVATTEVAEALGGCPGVVAVAVYGVAVPGHEGRAGMAALEVDAGFAMPALLAVALPDYARPVFLRLRAAIATTATFKPVKADLMREGFDPAAVADALYVFDRPALNYVALDAAMFDRIVRGQLRL